MAALVASTIRADVTATAADGFAIKHTVDMAVSPDAAWRELGRIGLWWDREHTYSGDARNMSLDLRAGGCFCERWSGGEIEHGRVVLVWPGQRTLRLDSALGPLQELGVSGALTFTIAAAEGGSRLSLSYNVSGSSVSMLEPIAPLVDSVLALQLTRLKRFAETGSPQ
jgi:hypothetical protein